MSGVIDYPPSAIAADFRTNTQIILAGTAVVTFVFSASPNRVALVVWTPPDDQWIVGPQNMVTFRLGIQVDTLSPPFILKFSDVGPLVWQEVYARQDGGASSRIAISEVIYEPRN